MYTAERQRAQPYLDQVTGPLFEQRYLLHHRMVRVVMNHRTLADEVWKFEFMQGLTKDEQYSGTSASK